MLQTEKESVKDLKDETNPSRGKGTPTCSEEDSKSHH